MSFLQFVKKLNIQATWCNTEPPPSSQTGLKSISSGSTDSPLERRRHLLDSFGTISVFNRCQSDMDSPSSGCSSPNSSSSSCLLFSVSRFSSVPLHFVSKPLLDTVRSLIFGSFFRSPVHSLQNKVFYQRWAASIRSSSVSVVFVLRRCLFYTIPHLRKCWWKKIIKLSGVGYCKYT